MTKRNAEADTYLEYFGITQKQWEELSEEYAPPMAKIGTGVFSGQCKCEAQLVEETLDYLGLEHSKENIFKVQATIKTMSVVGRIIYEM